MRHVLAADILEFDVLEVMPDAFIRVQVRSITRQALQMKTGGSTLGQVLLDNLAAMNRRTVPDNKQLPRYLLL